MSLHAPHSPATRFAVLCAISLLLWVLLGGAFFALIEMTLRSAP